MILMEYSIFLSSLLSFPSSLLAKIQNLYISLILSIQLLAVSISVFHAAQTAFFCE